MRSKFKDMIFVKGGKYTPCFTDDEKKVFDLEVCRYLTTQKMWLEVMDYNPSKFDGIYKPVDSVTWWEALEFCNKLSEKYNLEPVYDLSKKGILMINQLDGEKSNPNIADFKKTEGFRLPTEVEWEWFACGGEVAMQDRTFGFMYSGSNDIYEVGWYGNNSRGRTHDVGTKKPNQLGIYDCSGNVYEWCYDTANSGYISEKTPYIYDETESNRRLKGGSWYDKNNSKCILSKRNNDKATNNGGCFYDFPSSFRGMYASILNEEEKRPYKRFSDSYGFRIVRTI